MEQSAKAQQLPGAHKRVGKGRQKEHKREEELVEKEPPPSTAQPMQTVQPVLPGVYMYASNTHAHITKCVRMMVQIIHQCSSFTYVYVLHTCTVMRHIPVLCS